jgi:hypothetical protein
MADVLPPVDPNVSIPPAVKQAAEAADAIHKALYPDSQPSEQQPQPDPDPDQQPPQQPEEQPDQQPSDERVSASQESQRRPPIPDSGEHGSWEHRYLAMKGRFDQSQMTLGQMQEQMSELGDELMRTQQSLQMARAGLAPRSQQPQRPQQPLKTITKEDEETYGPELIEFVTRAARGAVAPELNQVTQQVRQTSQAVRQTSQQRMEADLDARLPDWRDINVSQRFKQWVGLRDIYSGQVRRVLINDAAKAADAPRVAAFFQAFLNEEQATGQMPVPQSQPSGETPVPRQAAVDLSTLASPGRAKPASGNGIAVAADKPVFTRAQISQFYSNEGRNAYIGRDADRKRDEQEIFAAQREGRVR